MRYDFIIWNRWIGKCCSVVGLSPSSSSLLHKDENPELNSEAINFSNIQLTLGTESRIAEWRWSKNIRCMESLNNLVIQSKSQLNKEGSKIHVNIERNISSYVRNRRSEILVIFSTFNFVKYYFKSKNQNLSKLAN